MSLVYRCREAHRSQLGCQVGVTTNTACASQGWVPGCTASLGAPPPTPRLCFQVSLPACGASLDHCHLQHILTLAYSMCLFKMSTAAPLVGGGPRGTWLYTSDHTVKLWVYQPGTGDAEWSHCKYAG